MMSRVAPDPQPDERTEATPKRRMRLRDRLAAWVSTPVRWWDWLIILGGGLACVGLGWVLSLIFTPPVIVPSPAPTVTATPAPLVPGETEVGQAVVSSVETTSGGARIVRVHLVDDEARVFGISELAGGLREGDRVLIYRGEPSPAAPPVTITPTPAPTPTPARSTR